MTNQCQQSYNVEVSKNFCNMVTNQNENRINWSVGLCTDYVSNIAEKSS